MTLPDAEVRSISLASLTCHATPSLLSLESWVNEASLTAAGDLGILGSQTTALFCSSQCPGAVILRTFDRMTVMRDRGETVLGGFHSPMERDCLHILLRGRQPIVIVVARSLFKMRLAPELAPAYRDGRLLLLSPFGPQHKRVTMSLATRRNRFAAAIATNILLAYAAPGSRTAALVEEIRAAGKPIETIPLS